MARFEIKINEKTENPNLTNYVNIEISGHLAMLEKIKKEIEQLAEAEEWEVY